MANILHIDKRAPHLEQGSEELGNDVVARLNPSTGQSEMWIELFDVPITADLRLAWKD